MTLARVESAVPLAHLPFDTTKVLQLQRHNSGRVRQMTGSDGR